MGETPGDTVGLGPPTLRFKVTVQRPGEKRFFYDYGPYMGWVHMVWDAGFITGWLARYGYKVEHMKFEYFDGDTPIEIKGCLDQSTPN